ncbi:MAG: hypothetical protein V7784_04155 [Oceanospirillaceae bacterium]
MTNTPSKPLSAPVPEPKLIKQPIHVVKICGTHSTPAILIQPKSASTTVQQVSLCVVPTQFIANLHDELYLYVDQNLPCHPVLISHQSDHDNPHENHLALLYPKALQQMPYLRGLQESFLLMIPWLGLAISLVSLWILRSTKRNASTKKPLKFTFKFNFYLCSGLITGYPILFILLDINQFLWAGAIFAYILLCCLNGYASYERNQRVQQYNMAILQQAKTDS